MKDLSVYPTDDLLTELSERCESFVFMGEVKGIKTKDIMTIYRFKGNNFICSGFTSALDGYIMHDYHKKTHLVKTTER